MSLLVFVVLALVLAGCVDSEEPQGGESTGGEGTGDTDDDERGEPSQGALAAAEFVAAAVEGRNADSYFASNTLDREELGAPFDPDVLSERFAELEAFGGSVETVEPSTSAYPDAADELGPACDRSSGLYCQVDLYDSANALLGSVVVYWFGDGVTDYSIIARSSSGEAVGIGDARCGAGLTLLHGGHTDRFDVAICAGGSGDLEYSGAERGTDLSIRLDACQDGSDVWVADNDGFQYVVDGSISPVRSQLDVLNPSGTSIENGPFTSVHLAQAATPSFC